VGLRRVLRLAAALVLPATALAVLAGAAPARETGPLTVQVVARDFSFKLSRRSVPASSTVRFVVRNRGQSIHDFVVNGRRTRLLRPGRSQTITVRFPRKGTFTFLCSVSGHARLGMKGRFGVGSRTPTSPPPPPPVVVSGTAKLTRIGGFDAPDFVTAPPGDASSVFVVEQSGTVRIVRDGQPLPTPFLDLRDQVTYAGESGLLSVAFAPDYAQSGHVYAFYNSRHGAYGDSRISEFRRSASDPDTVDPSSEQVLLTIPKPYENHNGGMLQFGPDGYLYASVGDGDPGVLNPAGIFAQRLDLLLGKILRIDPRSGTPYSIPPGNPFAATSGARPETWAYGLRNAWRFWIDSTTRDMIIGDVGSTSREELDVIPSGTSGQDFGWPCFEGTVAFDTKETCPSPVAPALEIPHDDGVCALVGGVVVHDMRLPALSGRYLYGDLCNGKVMAVASTNGKVSANDPLGLEVPSLTSFGVDALDRVYLTAGTGDVYRLDPTG
jgi:glucose/arabinose dehydrogenase/plastocyanin